MFNLSMVSKENFDARSGNSVPSALETRHEKDTVSIPNHDISP